MPTKTQSEVILTDTSKMPFGKYKNIFMQDVPVNYLHWLWHNSNQINNPVMKYIQNNLDVLKMENKDLIWKK